MATNMGVGVVERRCGSVGRSILPDHVWGQIAKILTLSSRELQIVQGMFDDLEESAIADNLRISTHTVHTYVGRLYRKLRVSSRTALILAVFEAYVQRCSQRTLRRSPRDSKQATIRNDTPAPGKPR